METFQIVGEDIAKFQFNRVIKEIKGNNKVFCLLCEVRDHSYTKDGLRQHIRATHQGQSLDYAACVEDMLALSLQETMDMLAELSAFNKVSLKYKLFA